MQAKADGINFVVNDKVTYTSVSQFKSEDTRKAYIQTTKMKSELTAKCPSWPPCVPNTIQLPLETRRR